jgi:hypothetical protein
MPSKALKLARCVSSLAGVPAHGRDPALVGRAVLADLAVLGRIDGDAAQVPDLHLEDLGRAHRGVGLGVQRREAGQRAHAATEVDPAGPPRVLRQRAAGLDRQALRTGHQRREVRRPGEIGHHARQRDVAGLVHGEQAGARGGLVLARELGLRLGEELALLLLHAVEEDLLATLQHEQRQAGGGEHDQRREHEVAQEPEPRGRRGSGGRCGRVGLHWLPIVSQRRISPV